jgi:hypothetical protein
MSEKIGEKVSTGKVADNIRRDAKEAGKKLVSDIVKSFTDKGFSSKEVAPLVKQGVKESADS